MYPHSKTTPLNLKSKTHTTMSQAIIDMQRVFWQIAVRHAAFLNVNGYASNAGFFSDRFAEMTGKDVSFREEFRQDWDGVHYEDFQEVEERRRSYHNGEQSLQLRRLWQQMLALPEGEPAAELTLSDVEAPIPRQMLCKAVHDTSGWQYRTPEEVDDEPAVELNVYCLTSGEIDELGRRALDAARHSIALEVLDEVNHYLGGYEAYDSDQRTALPSPSDIADAVQAEHADQPRAERVNIARREYKLESEYNGHTDERSVRKALNEAFRRREE
ncbi:hypothetical protein [Salinibacter ruber]|uniref:hypothetical protein n=1 Tax=Salinibacter ruber TaxID=146919 RepID=UPI00216A8967|nr:hypothetical protein [Salinibacter ruber]MCS3699175.1 hypothetical protein [Salinibacter ruber]MCS4096930.1 hypothetical protein [Salinibacter ruber]